MITDSNFKRFYLKIYVKLNLYFRILDENYGFNFITLIKSPLTTSWWKRLFQKIFLDLHFWLMLIKKNFKTWIQFIHVLTVLNVQWHHFFYKSKLMTMSILRALWTYYLSWNVRYFSICWEENNHFKKKYLYIFHHSIRTVRIYLFYSI